jgi:DNA-binding NtrC family response regulator
LRRSGASPRRTCGSCRSCLQRPQLVADAVLLDLVVQGALADPEQLGGEAAITVDLRERRADLLPNARSLLTRIAAALKCPMPSLTKAAEPRPLTAPWRGNVRELANALERAAILADGAPIDADHIWVDEPSTRSAPAAANLVRPLVDLERDAIVAALAQVDGNRRLAAELLGIGERTLYDKIKKYGISD